jgi:hypothetical protein
MGEPARFQGETPVDFELDSGRRGLRARFMADRGVDRRASRRALSLVRCRGLRQLRRRRGSSARRERRSCRVLERGRRIRLDGPSVRILHVNLDDAMKDESDQEDEVARISGEVVRVFGTASERSAVLKPEAQHRVCRDLTSKPIAARVAQYDVASKGYRIKGASAPGLSGLALHSDQRPLWS